MAKIDLKFLCNEQVGSFIKCEETDGEIVVFLEEVGVLNCLILDKSTAIKFAKTLRTEINKIQDDE